MALPTRRVFVALLVPAAAAMGACAAAEDETADGLAANPTVSSADGTPISYDMAGDGATTLVLVHGWSCDRTYYDAQLEAFATDHRVVRVDLAGHGASGATRRAYSIASFGADVAAVVNSLDLSSVVLVGHSMGGDVIVEAAKLVRERVAGLIWVDTYKSLPIHRTEAELAALIAPFREDFRGTTQAFVRGMFPVGADSALVSRVATDMSAAPPDVALSALESALRYAHEMPAALEAIKLPVLAINSDNSPTDAEALRTYGVESLIMPGAGHFLMMEDPGRFNALLRQALQRISTAPAR